MVIMMSYMLPEKPVCRSRSKLEVDMEQQTGSKLGKEYVKAAYCHLAYLTFMQSTSCEMPDWNQDCQEKYPTISDMQILPL